MTETTTKEPEQLDYSKTKRVVVWDLLFKALSAIGLLVIGAVTLWFQISLEMTRKSDADTAKREQQYLPFFRNVTEINVALAETSSQFGYLKYTEDEAMQESRLGVRINYLVDDLNFPDEPDYGNRTQLLAPKINHAEEGDDRATPDVELSLNQTLRLLTSLLRLAPELNEMDRNANATVTATKKSLLFSSSQGKRLDEVPLSQQLGEVYSKWLPPNTKVHDLYTEFDDTNLCDSVVPILTAYANKLVTARPELAEKYVTIRNDVLHTRQELVPSPK